MKRRRFFKILLGLPLLGVAAVEVLGKISTRRWKFNPKVVNTVPYFDRVIEVEYDDQIYYKHGIDPLPAPKITLIDGFKWLK